MTPDLYTFGHHLVRGVPRADWSHSISYIAALYAERLRESFNDDLSADWWTLDRDFRQRLLRARGIDELSDEDRSLAEELSAAKGFDVSYLPGGSNYPVSLSGPNPLGLPGDLWALVTDASDGAFVAFLMRPDGTGELQLHAPDGVGWLPLADLTVISDYTIVGVMPEAVALFRNYDRDNTLGVISSYPLSAAGPFPARSQMEIPMPRDIPEPRAEDDEYWKRTGESYGSRGS